MRLRIIALLATTIVVALAAGLVALATPPKYVSTVSMLVGPVSSDLDTLRASELLSSTYSQLIVRPEAVQQVASFVKLTPQEVSDASAVTFNTDTRIVTLTVTTGSAATSTRISSALTAQLTRLVGTVDPTSPGAVQILSVEPQRAVRTDRSVGRYALLGAAGWLLLAVGVLAAFAARPSGSPSDSPEPESPTPTSAADDPQRVSERV